MSRLPALYGDLTWQERREAREEYKQLQRGLCWNCKMPLNEQPPPWFNIKDINKKLFPENFFNYPEHLHHNHKTGLTIGTVHAVCNAWLWQYKGE